MEILVAICSLGHSLGSECVFDYREDVLLVSSGASTLNLSGTFLIWLVLYLSL